MDRTSHYDLTINLATVFDSSVFTAKNVTNKGQKTDLLYGTYVTYLENRLPGHPADWQRHGAIHLVVVTSVQLIVCSEVRYLYLVRLPH
jgi:hypothetical protein